MNTFEILRSLIFVSVVVQLPSSVDWRAVWDPSPCVWKPMPQQRHMLQPSPRF